eukprot:UN12430
MPWALDIYFLKKKINNLGCGSGKSKIKKQQKHG